MLYPLYAAAEAYVARTKGRRRAEDKRNHGVQVDELSDESRTRVLDAHRECALEDGWYDDLRESHERQINKAGFVTDDVGLRYSGNGASFAGQADVLRFTKAHKLGNRYKALVGAFKSGETQGYVEVSIAPYMRESAQLNMYVEGHIDIRIANLERFDRVEWQVEDCMRDVHDAAIKLAAEYENAVGARREHLTSDDYVASVLAQNEAEFLHDGTPLERVVREYVTHA